MNNQIVHLPPSILRLDIFILALRGKHLQPCPVTGGVLFSVTHYPNEVTDTNEITYFVGKFSVFTACCEIHSYNFTLSLNSLDWRLIKRNKEEIRYDLHDLYDLLTFYFVDIH